MKILVINCGSSSLKYQLIDMKDESVLLEGLVERIGIEGSRIKHDVTGKDRVLIEETMEDHRKALELVFAAIVDEDHGAIKSLDEIKAVGHRVVHGGEAFANSVVIDDEVLEGIRNCIELAPLHNPANIMGIEACKDLMPNTPMVAVFDTAFHQTMPEKNYMYALPYNYYEDFKIRRYGFHGTSHKYITERAANILDKSIENTNIISCHLGNGSSITAVKDGKSIDTSMGFTPLAGLPMGTRTGDIDPAIIPFIVEKESLDMAELNDLLNKKSGVLGISGVSSDFRDLEEASNEGNKRAELALDMFTNSVKKFIGSYMTQVENLDAIVFTAGIGENSGFIREKVCKGLEGLGIELDFELNSGIRGEEKVLSKDSSKIKVLVIPTNEELMIAKDTLALTSK